MEHRIRPLDIGAGKRAALAVVLAAASMGASALPSFTFNPGGASLNGGTFTADNLLVFNYSTVTSGTGGSFSETGYLSVIAAQNGSQSANTAGLNADYGLYIQFTGQGSTVFGTDPMTGTTVGTITQLNYTLYGYNGPQATFGFDANNMPTTTASGAVALASGSLIPGSGSVTTTVSAPSFSPSANAKLTFSIASGAAGFFVQPTPFLNTALTSFSNTSSQVALFAGGFMIQQGGGSVNFASTPVPEPATYAMLGSGLLAVAFMARRKRRALLSSSSS